MTRIGIFGGSFDPVHNGHVDLARRALKVLRLARVWFVPAADSPFKIGEMRASAEDRFAMLELACGSEPRLGVSRADIDRGGVSYTYDLVAGFRAENPDAELVFLLGADSLVDLHKWHRAEELVRLCRFVAFARPGVRIDPASLGFDAATNARLAADVISDFSSPVSSTIVRARLATGFDADALVPPTVAHYIRRRGLYRAAPSP